MSEKPQKPRRGIIAEAFHPFLVLFTIIICIAGLYFLSPLLHTLLDWSLFIAEKTGVDSLYVMIGMGALAVVLGALVFWVYIAPIFKHPCYDFSAPQALADSTDKEQYGLLQRQMKRHQFDAFVKHLLEAPVPENMDSAHRGRHKTAIDKLRKAQTDEEKCEAINEIGLVREEHMKCIVHSHVLFVSLSTAISQKSMLDAYLAFASNIRMIRELIIASGHRPNYKDCLLLYIKSAVYALTSITAQELTDYLSTVQIVKAGKAAGLAGAHGAAGIIAGAFSLVNPAAGISVGAALGGILNKVGKTVVDCTPSMMDGLYNGWRTMRLGYHLSDTLTGVYFKDARSNDSMWRVATDLPEVIRAMMANIFNAIGKNLNTGEAEITDARKVTGQEGNDTVEPEAGPGDRRYENEGRECAEPDPEA